MTTEPLCSYLNALASEERKQTLLKCCGSSRWASQLNECFPFSNDEDLYQAADSIWAKLDRSDFLEAFSHHPQIGADPEVLRQKFQKTHSWSSNEQSGMKQASEECILALAKGNQSYLDRFGYIFIVCATGKSAEEMLELLEDRLSNSSEEELRIAAGEQGKITIIRLNKLIPQEK
ncbi:MAG: OHCU decarboxylase [Proteobacteria bacterium]|nr:OHCU decarboxylase [Pseudomonadota bacterium]